MDSERKIVRGKQKAVLWSLHLRWWRVSSIKKFQFRLYNTQTQPAARIGKVIQYVVFVVFQTLCNVFPQPSDKPSQAYRKEKKKYSLMMRNNQKTNWFYLFYGGGWAERESELGTYKYRPFWWVGIENLRMICSKSRRDEQMKSPNVCPLFSHHHLLPCDFRRVSEEGEMRIYFSCV